MSPPKVWREERQTFRVRDDGQKENKKHSLLEMDFSFPTNSLLILPRKFEPSLPYSQLIPFLWIKSALMMQPRLTVVRIYYESPMIKGGNEKHQQKEDLEQDGNKKQVQSTE